jgi:hypothetical protein
MGRYRHAWQVRGEAQVHERIPGESPIEEFWKGLARVSIKDGIRPNEEGYIDRTGKFVWEPTN